MARRIVAGCRWLVDRTAFHVTVMLFIVISIVLLSVEITMSKADDLHNWVVDAQDVITGFFVIELVVRFIAFKRRSRFLREYWLDVLAVVAVFPVFRLFRLARFLRLLRLLRMFRVARTLSSNSRLLNTLLERRITEYFLAGVLLAMTVLTGTLGLVFFENPHDGVDDLHTSFWTTIFSLISTQYATDYPPTLGGKLVMLFVIFSGLTFFAVLTGTVSAIMIEKLKEGGILNMTDLEDLEGHVIICGWNTGVEIVLAQLQSDPQFRDRDYVVIAERDDLPFVSGVNRARVRLLKEDFTRVEVLRKANVMTAAVAVIVSDVAHGRSRQDADARTVLASLTIEKLNSSVHTCAELSNSMNEHHLRLGKVNEVIITQDLAGRLLAQAALDSTRSRVIQELLQESSLSRYPVLESLAGKSFREVLGALPGAIPIAVRTAAGDVLLNPEKHVLQADDVLLCVGVPKLK